MVKYMWKRVAVSSGLFLHILPDISIEKCVKTDLVLSLQNVVISASPGDRYDGVCTVLLMG